MSVLFHTFAKKLNGYHQYGQDDSLYNYLVSAYHIEGMSELAVKHRDKVKLYEAPTGIENVHRS